MASQTCSLLTRPGAGALVAIAIPRTIVVVGRRPRCRGLRPSQHPRARGAVHWGMAADGHVPVQGSERAPLPGAVLEGPADPDEPAQVTLVVRRRPDAFADLFQRVERATWRHPRLGREQLAIEHGADPSDLDRIVSLATRANLQILGTDLLTRHVQLGGSVADLQSFFGTELGRYTFADGSYRGRIGAVHIPAELGGIVQAVLGLDDRPQAQPRVALAAATPGVVMSLAPAAVARLYNFPGGLTGQNQCIGIIELGGGYQLADLQTFFAQAGLPLPSITAISVDGGQNAPSNPPGIDDIETALDIQVAAGVASGAAIAVYFAPNTDRGFLDAITTAIHDTVNRPSIISISWGSAEINWTQQAMQAIEQALIDAAALGISVCCASGDYGSGDSVPDGLAHADFPASAPHALGCGGTLLDVGGDSINSESVWNSASRASGGGISDVFPLPAWQVGAGVPPSINPNRRIGRGVPDVSADADPASGYQIVVGGNWQTIGGTSAVAPLWSGFLARLNQSLNSSVGFLQPFLYTPAVRQSCFRDIVSGNNGAYEAASGWDACTGLGSPNGRQLLTALSIGLGDHFYTASASERDSAIAQYAYLSAGIAGYVAASPTTVPLYRLTGDHHFFTTSLAERDAAISQSGFSSDGVTAWVWQSPANGLTPLFRLANFSNGDHFYTTSSDERDAAIRDYGYQSEGITCYVYSTPTASTSPVFRLANNATNDHFYTASPDERDAAVAQYGYQFESIAFYANTVADTAPLYRLANSHHWYTTSLSERDDAVAHAGQRAEDVACFVWPLQFGATNAFHRLLNPTNGARFYTVSLTERDAAIADLGYQLEGTCCFLYADPVSGTSPLYRLLKTDTQ
jgi:kumamolisin